MRIKRKDHRIPYELREVRHHGDQGISRPGILSQDGGSTYCGFYRNNGDVVISRNFIPLLNTELESDHKAVEMYAWMQNNRDTFSRVTRPKLKAVV